MRHALSVISSRVSPNSSQKTLSGNSTSLYWPSLSGLLIGATLSAIALFVIGNPVGAICCGIIGGLCLLAGLVCLIRAYELYPRRPSPDFFHHHYLSQTTLPPFCPI